ncbi:hypothetical protein N7447_008737 [Penicillium robsamsonii]|uniref:uncharacterized protein n=1 Tax=Penicillium robsamsonii TaxID=1792511 RepID=UPI002548373A|nr:uncharacterized protein N7447_008737 [Penicillium robsamsonii]KAJ5816504.1 hypothetical protein N7447_008737 [Penicillium robsamsonii]
MHLRPVAPFITGVLSLYTISATATQVDLSQYVNPLIGSEGPEPGTSFGGGDIFVGGALPFSVAKVGIGSTAANWNTATLNGGWTPDGNVTGISMMYESGTGGSPKYGLVSQMPLTYVGSPVNVLDNLTYSQPRVGKDIAKVGYFMTHLENEITVESSASRHAGIIEFSFPDGERHILVDISHYLPSNAGDANGQFFAGGEIQMEADGKAYSGYGTYVGGWNNGAPFTVYFYGEFSKFPDSSQTFSGANTDHMPRYQNLGNGGMSEPKFRNTSSKVTSGPMNKRIGLLLSWNDGPASHVTSRVGISSMSTDRARSYIQAEIPSRKLNDTVAAAVKEWNENIFDKVQVSLDDSANMTHVRLLYSSLYFIHLMPSDRTGENPLHSGYMPEGRSGNWNGLVQGGSDADKVLAYAYVKGLRGPINWTEGILFRHASRCEDSHRIHGRPKTFESRLDLMFKPNMSVQNLRANGTGITTLMNIGNEPDFATPYLYNYINKQAKSVHQSRSLATQYPYIFSYRRDPRIYLNMTINGNKTLRISATDLESGYYVQSVKINGKQWEKNWFKHDEIMTTGGTIEFELGENAKAWETGDVPPSPGHVRLNRD